MVALVVTFLPVAIYAAFKYPYIFPLGAYCATIPLNDMSSFSSFGTLAKLLGFATLVVFVVQIVVGKRFVRPPLAIAAWLLLTLLMVISLTWAVDGTIGWQLLNTFVSLIALTMVVGMLPPSRGDLFLFVGSVAAGGVIGAATAIYRYGHGDSGQDGRLYVGGGNDAIDPNFFAASLLLPAAILGMQALRSKSAAGRVASVLLLCLVLTAILMTGSRGATIAFGAILLTYLFFSRYRKAMTILVAGIAIAAVPLVPFMMSRFAIALDTGGAGRANIWRVGLEAIPREALFGVGFGDFPNAYDVTLLHVLAPTFEGWHRAPHNVALQTTVELGFAGLTLLVLAFAAHGLLLSKLPATDPYGDLRLVCVASLAAFVVASFFLDALYSKSAWLIFLMTIMLRSASIVEQSRRGDSASLARARPDAGKGGERPVLGGGAADLTFERHLRALKQNPRTRALILAMSDLPDI